MNIPVCRKSVKHRRHLRQMAVPVGGNIGDDMGNLLSRRRHRRSIAPVQVFQALDIVLADIFARLHLDQMQRFGAFVFQPM